MDATGGTEPEVITLDRSGLPPLQFTGELIAHASGQFVNTEPQKPNNDWWEISVFVVQSLRPHSAPLYKNVVAVTYHNTRRNGYTHRAAFVTGDPVRSLTEYQPLSVLVNYPPDPPFQSRQAALERLCLQQWQTLVSAVLHEFPEKLT